MYYQLFDRKLEPSKKTDIVKVSNKCQENKNTTVSTQEHIPFFKVGIIGNSGVGKSSLLLRFTDDEFDENTKPTIGADFKVKEI